MGKDAKIRSVKYRSAEHITSLYLRPIGRVVFEITLYKQKRLRYRETQTIKTLTEVSIYNRGFILEVNILNAH